MKLCIAWPWARLPPGKHELIVERDSSHSAQGSALQVAGAQFREIGIAHADYSVYVNAPALFIRKNTIGLFSDVPLLLYGEKLNEGGRGVLQYTVVFSNEDGGTSTRALMARWGRATDIEYIYRVYLDSAGGFERLRFRAPDTKNCRTTAGARARTHC